MPARSLRRLLLGWLLAPLLILLALGTLGTVYIARGVAHDAYDKELLDPMLVLAQHIVLMGGQPTFNLTPAARDLLLVDAYDNIYYQLSAAHARPIGNLNLPVPAGIGDRALFYDASFGGREIRVAALRIALPDNSSAVLQVAETLNKRDSHMIKILLGMLAPALAIALAAVLLVWFGIRRGLAPLENLQTELAARSHRDLRPVPENHAPEEVRPLVVSLNALLRRLNEAQASQQRFLANAAHQLRTPLAGLQTQVELALRGHLPEDLRPTLAHLHASTVRTAHLANQLLTLARAEPGALPPDAMQRLDLCKLVENAAHEWVPRALEKKLDLGFDMTPAWLVGEPLLLRELLANLIDNALRYTPAGGNITVRCGDLNGVFLEVEDNGIGIPAAAIAKVCERFYRVEGSPGDGCGLGLAIVEEIARIHDAALDISAPDTGRGTLIRLRFPQTHVFSST